MSGPNSSASAFRKDGDKLEEMPFYQTSSIDHPGLAVFIIPKMVVQFACHPIE
jgi:hypothetical protein